jgi:hypothetical protein
MASSSQIPIADNSALPHPDELPVRKTLPTTYADPGRLARELTTVFGKNRYRVEMRRDVYNIMAIAEFSLVSFRFRAPASNRSRLLTRTIVG